MYIDPTAPTWLKRMLVYQTIKELAKHRRTKA